MANAGGFLFSGPQWQRVYDSDWTQLRHPGDGNLSLGTAEGAKTFDGNANWFLLNDAILGPYLAADPNGLYISETAGEGLIMQTAAVVSLNDLNGDLGPAFWIELPDLLDVNVWPATQAGRIQYAPLIGVSCIVDVSASAAAQEHAGIVCDSDATMNRGQCAGYGFGAALDNRACMANNRAAFWNDDRALTVALDKTSIAVAACLNGNSQDTLWGEAAGTQYPAQWYTHDRQNVATLSLAGGAACFHTTGVVGVYGCSGAGNSRLYNFKRFSVWLASYRPLAASPANVTVA